MFFPHHTWSKCDFKLINMAYLISSERQLGMDNRNQWSPDPVNGYNGKSDCGVMATDWINHDLISGRAASHAGWLSTNLIFYTFMAFMKYWLNDYFQSIPKIWQSVRYLKLWSVFSGIQQLNHIFKWITSFSFECETKRKRTILSGFTFKSEFAADRDCALLISLFQSESQVQNK